MFVTTAYSFHPNVVDIPRNFFKDIDIPFVVKRHEISRMSLDYDKHVVQDLAIQEKRIEIQDYNLWKIGQSFNKSLYSFHRHEVPYEVPDTIRNRDILLI